MSFLGLGGNPAASGTVNRAKIENAEAELDLVTDMFTRLIDSCHTKCITSHSNYTEGDLTRNESLCLDRCVAKYFAVNEKVGAHMQKLGAGGFMKP